MSLTPDKLALLRQTLVMYGDRPLMYNDEALCKFSAREVLEAISGEIPGEQTFTAQDMARAHEDGISEGLNRGAGSVEVTAPNPEHIIAVSAEPSPAQRIAGCRVIADAVVSTQLSLASEEQLQDLAEQVFRAMCAAYEFVHPLCLRITTVAKPS